VKTKMTNDQVSMTNQENTSPIQRAFDLAERTAVFGEAVIRFCRGIRRDAVITPLIRQLVRSATSIGANYVEVMRRVAKRSLRIALVFADAKREKHNIVTNACSSKVRVKRTSAHTLARIKRARAYPFRYTSKSDNHDQIINLVIDPWSLVISEHGQTDRL
jgi:hypothetical protein